MITRGEQYQYSLGEKEAIEKANALIVEAFNKLKEAQAILDEATPYCCTLDLDLDISSYGEFRLPVNFDTTLRIVSSLNDQWMSSYNDC